MSPSRLQGVAARDLLFNVVETVLPAVGSVEADDGLPVDRIRDLDPEAVREGVRLGEEIGSIAYCHFKRLKVPSTTCIYDKVAMEDAVRQIFCILGHTGLLQNVADALIRARPARAHGENESGKNE